MDTCRLSQTLAAESVSVAAGCQEPGAVGAGQGESGDRAGGVHAGRRQAELVVDRGRGPHAAAVREQHERPARVPRRPLALQAPERLQVRVWVCFVCAWLAMGGYIKCR